MKNYQTLMIGSLVVISTCFNCVTLAEENDMRVLPSTLETFNLMDLKTTDSDTSGQEIKVSPITSTTQTHIKDNLFVIGKEIQKHWAKPHSARYGMAVVLEVSLMPTGHLVNITIAESSGNQEFDKSVIQAAQHASPFKVLTKIKSEMFERHFRKIKLKFNPADYW